MDPLCGSLRFARPHHRPFNKKYGPVVRVAPNELCFSSLECIKPIYRLGTTCIKSSAYDNFGKLGMFQMQDPEQHRQRQKRIAHIFATSSLQQMEPSIQSVVDRLIEAIEKRADKSVDALHWCRMTALDISGRPNWDLSFHVFLPVCRGCVLTRPIGEILLGKSFGAFDADGEAPAYVHHLDNAYLIWSLYGLAPILCTVLALHPSNHSRDSWLPGTMFTKYGFHLVRAGV